MQKNKDIKSYIFTNIKYLFSGCINYDKYMEYHMSLKIDDKSNLIDGLTDKPMRISSLFDQTLNIKLIFTICLHPTPSIEQIINIIIVHWPSEI